jgi:hypothetical protein
MTREDIISNMQTLIQTPAWTAFKEYVQKNDLALDKGKLEEAERSEGSNLSDIRFLRLKIDALEQTLEMPEKIISNLQTIPKSRDEDRDPYPQDGD